MSQEQEFHYYFFDGNMHSLDPEDLGSGPRIFKIKKNLPSPSGANSDGPFNSVRALKRYSPRFKRYNTINHKRALKICEDKWIPELSDQRIATPSRKGYPKEFIKSIQHATNGSIKKGELNGVHFYDAKKVKILEILNQNDFGVFEARFQFYNQKLKEWFEKPGSSTFFPQNWSLTQLFHEIAYAYFEYPKEKIVGMKNYSNPRQNQELKFE